MEERFERRARREAIWAWMAVISLSRVSRVAIVGAEWLLR